MYVFSCFYRFFSSYANKRLYQNGGNPQSDFSNFLYPFASKNSMSPSQSANAKTSGANPGALKKVFSADTRLESYRNWFLVLHGEPLLRLLDRFRVGLHPLRHLARQVRKTIVQPRPTIPTSASICLSDTSPSCVPIGPTFPRPPLLSSWRPSGWPAS